MGNKIIQRGITLNEHTSSFIKYVGFDDRANIILIQFKRDKDVYHYYILTEKQYLFVKDIFQEKEKMFDRLFSNFVKKLAKHQQDVMQVANG